MKGCQKYLFTDFWQIGHGKAARLESNHLYTMGDIAERSQWDEEWFYKAFGIDAEILIDPADKKEMWPKYWPHPVL